MLAFWAPLNTSITVPVASDSFSLAMVDNIFCAITVPSKNLGGFLQTSQLPQSVCKYSPK